MVKALDGVDFLFHQAAAVGVPQSMYEIRRYTEINSLGGATVLDAAINTPAVRDRLRKMVVASSMSIYGEGPAGARCTARCSPNPDGAQLQRGE